MKNRIIIDWIRTIIRCEVCGTESKMYNAFWITNARTSQYCSNCKKLTDHIVVAHEASYVVEDEIC